MATFQAATRTEHDSFGAIEVPAGRLWGAQTQRSLAHFAISTERLPDELVQALARVKAACARVNRELGLLTADKAAAIDAAAQEVLAGRHAGEFPLSVWQTGSGTQSNMNMNEVLANRASELLGGARGPGRCVHPNDEVNLGQSSNDIFPTAMHLAAALGIAQRLQPARARLQAALAAKSAAFAGIVKIGRTHLQDATPLTLGQEFSGYVAQLAHAGEVIDAALPSLYPLAVGGTAVGTGLNTHPEFGARVAAALAGESGLPFVSARQQVRGAGRTRRAGGGARRAQDAGGGADEDRQRPALAGLGAALRAGRDRPARERAGQFDHAGQGQPDPVRGADHALLPGARQRCGGQHRRRLGQLRAERATSR